jgi:hypothetical protein
MSSKRAALVGRVSLAVIDVKVDADARMPAPGAVEGSACAGASVCERKRDNNPENDNLMSN